MSRKPMPKAPTPKGDMRMNGWLAFLVALALLASPRLGAAAPELAHATETAAPSSDTAAIDALAASYEAREQRADEQLDYRGAQGQAYTNAATLGIVFLVLTAALIVVLIVVIA
jgi:hypothetical protein